MRRRGGYEEEEEEEEEEKEGGGGGRCWPAAPSGMARGSTARSPTMRRSASAASYLRASEAAARSLCMRSFLAGGGRRSGTAPRWPGLVLGFPEGPEELGGEGVHGEVGEVADGGGEAEGGRRDGTPPAAEASHDDGSRRYSREKATEVGVVNFDGGFGKVGVGFAE